MKREPIIIDPNYEFRHQFAYQNGVELWMYVYPARNMIRYEVNKRGGPEPFNTDSLDVAVAKFNELI